MDTLDSLIKSKNSVAYVAYGSSLDADIKYLTHFKVTDPIIYLKKFGERGTIIVSTMEYERAIKESITHVITRNDAGFFDYLKEESNNRIKATARMIASVTGGNILVPSQFPYALARELESFCRVEVDDGTVESLRSIKSINEIRSLKKVQQVAEVAMNAAILLIREAIPKKGILFKGKSPLTSEYVKTVIQKCLIDHGCFARDTIVSCGENSAIPHNTGTGPLYYGKPIIIDIFPQDEISGYNADITRTVVKGEPDTSINEMYEAVKEAQTRAISMIRAGVFGPSVHQDIVDFFKERGYESNVQGFIHNLGHGVGLDIHEKPVLGPGGTELMDGNVITVEPGLYYKTRGGVRLEDMGAVTRTGFDRFTSYSETLII